MKKIFVLLLPSLTLIAQENNDNLLASDQEKQLMKKEQQTISKGVSQQIDASMDRVAASSAASSGDSSDIMVVDPKTVASDWKAAFASLKEKRVPNPTFILKDKTKISGVSDIEALPGGYLMLFTISSVQGTRYQIVKTSDIVSLSSG